VLVGAVLGLYALRRANLVRRAAAYAGGCLLGVAPLLAFNTWAFGTPTHIAYEDYYGAGTEPAGGVFGFGVPSAANARDLLVSSMGLLTITPVVACGVAGAVVALRRRRPEAIVVLAVSGTYYLYNVSLSHASPFGGLGPPRYLIPMLPFLAVALACSYRRFPLTTTALAAVSAFQMVVMTATGALAAYDGDWLGRLERRDVVQTAASLVDVTGWYTIVPFLLAALVAAVCGALASPRVTPARSELPLALGALGMWAIVAAAADNPNGLPPATGTVAATTLVAAVLVAVLAVGARRSTLPWRSGIALRR
jgi:hypothetical protein